MQELKHLEGRDLKEMKAKEFSTFVCSFLKNGIISKEVFVPDRGDGHRGRIDLVISFDNGKVIAIELDRLKPRKKSIFKLKIYKADESYVITRSPFTIHTIK